MTVSVDVADVLSVLYRELDLDEGDIGPASTSDEVENWDSLGHLRVCLALEDRYGVTIPMAQVPQLCSVPAIVTFLSGR